jgi:signal transduction histidine kinase
MDFSELVPRTRIAVQRLCSPDDSNASLGEVFAGIPTTLGFTSGGSFQVVVHGRERELRAGLRNDVYFICREAIINAYRHSRARHIETEIEYRSTELRVAVRDNGCGIDPRKLQW